MSVIGSYAQAQISLDENGSNHECDRFVTHECDRFVTHECDRFVTHECDRFVCAVFLTS